MIDPLSDNQDSSPYQAVVGVVLGAHGVNGEVRVRVLSDVPHRFNPGETLLLQDRERTIESSSFSNRGALLLKLQGINSPAAARELTGLELTARTDSSPPLPEGEFFHYQLIGLQVVTDEGESLGRITEIIVTGSNDVYVVTGPGGDILLPALSQVILNVDLRVGAMTVHLMDGLR